MALIDNLISYWSLDEASGNALDSHGSHALTDNNTCGSAAGKVGNARTFNGSNEFFSKSDHADLSGGDIAITLQVWFLLNATGQFHFLIGKGTSDEYALFVTSANQLRFEVVNAALGSASATDGTTLTTGTWYYGTGWHDPVANQIGVALNAGTATTTAWTTGIRDGTGAFAIGARGNGSFLTSGNIDEAALWHRVLSGAERTELHNGGTGRDYAYISGGAAPAPIFSRMMLLGVG
jgi:hypothetical protein